MNLESIHESYANIRERQGFIPEHFQSTTAPELDDRSNGWNISTTKTPLWKFSSPRKKILSSKPVVLKISRGETHFFAENENLGIFVTGDSREEAIQTFCEQLVHFYLHYKKLNRNRVTGEAKRLKKIYENLFQETNS